MTTFTQPRNDYRRDIDGLRAIAILLVMGFHYFPSLISGGFIGVDIFFVISGYLISKHILSDLSFHTFSYKTFYARRIKRIFPALSVILLFCVLAGWVILTAEEYELLGKHIAAGAGFVANLVFWQEAGYFDTAADTKPLLHLWSLGIEEQFYIIWPLILSCFRSKIPKHLLWGILALGLLSLLYSGFIVHSNVVEDFYSPFTRFWEFVIGGALAYLAVHKTESNKLAWLSAWLGIGLLVLALTLLNKNSLFPGFYALLPTLAAASFIYAGEQAWFNRRVLAARPMVWLGLISYPLYLWHWPLLSLVRIMDGQTPSLATRISLVFISILLAWLTYRFVERPIRFKWKLKSITMILSVTMIVLCLMGLGIRQQSGFKQRHQSMLNANPASRVLGADKAKLTHNCGFSVEQKSHFEWCDNDPTQISRYAIVGDSKAEALYYGLVRESQVHKGGWILMGSAFPTASDPIRAQKFNLAINTINNNPDIKVVVLAIALRDVFNIDSNTGFIDGDISSQYPAKIALYSAPIKALQQSGKRVVFYIDNPTFPDPRSCISGGLTDNAFLNKFLYRTQNPRCSITYTAQLAGTAPYKQFVKQLQTANPGLSVFDPTTLLCNVKANICTVTENGNFLYSYDDHISDYANSKIAKQLLPKIYQLITPVTH